jgi:hypothetical protein
MMRAKSSGRGKLPVCVVRKTIDAAHHGKLTNQLFQEALLIALLRPEACQARVLSIRVRQRPDGSYKPVNGHHRAEAARRVGVERLTVSIVTA